MLLNYTCIYQHHCNQWVWFTWSDYLSFIRKVSLTEHFYNTSTLVSTVTFYLKISLSKIYSKLWLVFRNKMRKQWTWSEQIMYNYGTIYPADLKLVWTHTKKRIFVSNFVAHAKSVRLSAFTRINVSLKLKI